MGNPIDEPVITLSTGPVTTYPRVLQAMARPVHYDFDPYFQHHYEQVNRKVGRALQTDAAPLVLQGEPVLGLEAAAASLIGRGDVVLNLVSGVYGKGFGYWAARHAKEVIEVAVPFNEAIDPGQVTEALARRPDVKIVSVVHHDTPSGTINPVAEIGRLVRAHDALMLVDAVSSFGGMDIHPEACDADVFITGPNKCLGGAPGLSIVHVSERAWAHIEANPDTPTASVLSLADWRHAWRHDKPFPFTPSVAEINGLDAVMDGYFEEGPARVWARHALTARACRAGVKALGLSLWPAREAIAADTTTAVRVPEGVTDKEICAAARALHGVVFSVGRGDVLGKLIRIGHMGPSARPVYATVAVTALGGALGRLGVAVDLGAGVEAAARVIDEATP